MKPLFNRVAMCLAFAITLNANAQFPSDYVRATYEWREGSIPPPWHSQYRITIESLGPSDIVMIPGYPDVYSDEPRWRIKLSPTPAQLDALRKFIQDNDLFGNAWAAKRTDGVPQNPPTGGSTCTIIIAKSLNGGLFSNILPCNTYEVDNTYRGQRDAFVKMIHEMIPKDDWDRLNASLKEYANESIKKRADPDARQGK